ncbi:50S ribosomal protein L3 [Candidatus Saccharibacteria bacterium RIFCSPHIGHO2_12_FULL_49_19]|nr:MAG: 50S ribosomal protein L3 [Candidatus Saccharibacteria bacterium RIFCSPHIGHO2_01_FULL_49_21]OGL37799.1 MAG: 50S ribosomal protein L3 [Candidatus Saccharibacteria bacterium RIFCSPHIGHO2_12_FULL_49_19]OGL38590.1 MAG: 50S ribosomal protein L3 [Candidatus Saccharibacteria bacterium RIFCSPLOWO2_01_FULL_49_22]
MKALVTRKIGMTSAINDQGAAIAVTLLWAASNAVTQIKTDERDGYTAIQVGLESNRKARKAQAGHTKEAKITSMLMREFRIAKLPEDLKVGDHLSADFFNVGDKVDVTGVSKGKGFAGVIKRHNFQRGRKTHGGRSYRRPGSIGSMYPQRIFPGKKMAGQMGHVRVTTKRLTVALVDPELRVIGIAGAVPGPKKGVVLVREAK